jgi:D-aspartate ligase
MNTIFLHPAVVVTHGKGVNALGILRSLGRRGVKTHLVVFRGGGSLAVRSRYCSRIHWMEEETPAELLRVLNSIAAMTEEKPVLFYDSDEAMYLAAVSADVLMSKFLFTNSLAQIPYLQDKRTQAKIAELAGISIPRSWFLQTWDDLLKVSPACGRRLIVKPNPAVFVGDAPFKVFFATNASEVRAQLQQFVRNPVGMIVQEYIEGHDEHMWVVSGYRPFGPSSTTMVTMAKVKQSGSGAGGVGIIVRVEDNKRLKMITPRLLVEMEYFGAFALEFKYSVTDDEFVFIEANYRTARIHVLGRRVGGDLPAIIYADVTNLPEFATGMRTISGRVWYYDMVSCVSTFRKTQEIAVRLDMFKHMLLSPFRRTEWAIHAWDDPIPTIISTWKFVERTITGALRRIRKLVKPNVSGPYSP